MVNSDSPSGVGRGEVACPDPSVHEKHNRLSEAASTAALLVTQGERGHSRKASADKENPLDADGKLSSKSAATSLKYAKAQDLPSFPSSGNTADSAGKAAMLAKDYKMKDLWQPELSAAGSKAALLAHRKGGKLDLWQPATSPAGSSAATMAMRNKALSPELDYGYTEDGKKRALMAATQSVSNVRQRAISTPPPVHPAYPDSHNAGSNALNAATISHKASTKKDTTDGWDSQAMQASRITNMGPIMDRAMFTEHPPVEVEKEEARYNAALRASAISMAKQMYDPAHTGSTAAPSEAGAASAGAGAAHTRSPTSGMPADLKQEALRYINLQEAAHKLAAERLAKVDKNLEAARYREYYGYGNEGKSNRLSSRFSIRGGRKRASSEADADLEDSDDEEQARRIRSQMSQLNRGLDTVNAKQQQDDRARLMAAAEKRVSAQLHSMDEKVFLETGKVPPAMMEEWEEKARKRVAAEKVEKTQQQQGKTHIGGGRYMDQSEIEAIAAARLKPTLDEINDNAEKKRARDEELRLEKEEAERQKREERNRKDAEKAEQKRIKNEEKAAAKKEKEEVKARKSEDKRAAKEEHKAEAAAAADTAAAAATGATLAEVATHVKSAPEPTPDANAADAVEKHRSALSRLKDRFRKSDKHEDEHEDAVVASRPQTAATAATTTTAADGAATSAAIHDVPREEPALDATQAEHAVNTDAKKDEFPALVSAPVITTSSNETSSAAPFVAVTAAGLGAGALTEEHNYTAPATDVSPIDDEDDVVAQDNLQPQRPRFEHTASLHGLHADPIDGEKYNRPDLERHISQIPIESDDESDEDWDDDEILSGRGREAEEEPYATEEPYQAVPPVVAAAVVPHHENTEPVASTTHEPATVAEPEPVGTAAEIPVAHETQRAPAATTAAEEDTIPAAEHIEEPVGEAPVTSATTDAEPVPAATEPESAPVEEPSTSKAAVVASAIAAPAAMKEPAAAAPATKLHKDPPTRASGEYRAGKTTTPGFLTPATEYIRKTSVDLDSSRPANASADVETDESKRKGLRGLFKKLTSKSSRSDTKASTNGPTSVPEVVGEDAGARGRAGEKNDAERGNSSTNEETFEEARDHFDETLAPPPAFAGQAKSHSPTRGTKFQEEL